MERRASGARGRGGGLRRQEHPFESDPTKEARVFAERGSPTKEAVNQGTQKNHSKRRREWASLFSSAKQHDRRRRPLPFGVTEGEATGWARNDAQKEGATTAAKITKGAAGTEG